MPEASTLNVPPVGPPLELLEDELELLDELVLDDELLEELELDEEPLQLLIMPPLPPFWLLQVFRPIQLWLFSQPQPLFEFSHRGQTPSLYHWHCSVHCPPLEELLELVEEELLLLLELDDELELLLEELELLELEDELLDELEPLPSPTQTG